MDRFGRHALSYRSICAQCRRRFLPQRASLRSLSTSTPNFADTPDSPRQPPIDIPDAESTAAASMQQPADQIASPSIASTSSTAPDLRFKTSRPSMLTGIHQAQSNNNEDNTPEKSSGLGSTVESIWQWSKKNSPNATSSRSIAEYPPLPEPHHLHVYSTRHNTHITLTKPDRDAIISVSAGTIGFRKAARGTYDAAYQLGSYVMGRIQQQGLLTQILYLEIVLRDFGPGREAVTKVLLGSEGRNLRGRVVRVCDATRLKFGGTRSKNARRL